MFRALTNICLVEVDGILRVMTFRMVALGLQVFANQEVQLHQALKDGDRESVLIPKEDSIDVLTFVARSCTINTHTKASSTLEDLSKLRELVTVSKSKTVNTQLHDKLHPLIGTSSLKVLSFDHPELNAQYLEQKGDMPDHHDFFDAKMAEYWGNSYEPIKMHSKKGGNNKQDI